MPNPVDQSDVYRMPWEVEPTNDETSPQNPPLSSFFEDEPPAADEGNPEDQPESADSREQAKPEEQPEPESDEDEGDDPGEPDEEDDDEGAEEPELHAVRVDGEEKRVTLDELKRSYSYEAHQTRKAQLLTAEQKQFETERGAVRAEREQLRQKLEVLEQAMAQVDREPDWDALYAQDPQRFAIEKARWDQMEGQRRKIAEQRMAIQERQQQELMQQQEFHLREEQKRLVEAIPEWQDDAKAAEGKRELAEYAHSIGFTDEQLDAVSDHKAMVILRKAMLYDRSQARMKDMPKPKVQQSDKPVLKPGSTSRNPGKKVKKANRERAMERLARSGDVRDAADVFLAYGTTDD